METKPHRNDVDAQSQPVEGKSECLALDERERRNGEAGEVISAADISSNNMSGSGRGVDEKDLPLTNAGKSQLSDDEKAENNTAEVEVNATALPIYAAKAVSNKLKRVKRQKYLAEKFAKTRKERHDASVMMSSTGRLAPSLDTNDTHESPSTLVASTVPSKFPPELVFRALAAYSTLRTLSIPLRISPFTPFAFMRALSLPFHSELVGIVHSNILRVLFAHHGLGRYDSRGEGFSKVKLPLTTKKQFEAAASEYLAREESLHKEGGENLTYLDANTWPLYFADYLSIFNLTKSTEETEDDSNGLESADDVTGVGTAEMDVLFKTRPSDIPLSSCEPPYRDFPWMKDDVLSPPIVTRGKRKRMGKGGRRTRRKKNNQDHSSGDESNSDLDQQESSKARPLSDGQGIAFCESEKNPRSIEESVHQNILLCLESLEKSMETATESEGDHLVDNKVVSPDDEEVRESGDSVVESSSDNDLLDIVKTSSYESYSVKTKISIIEYLLDEVLDIDFFRIEMDARMEKSMEFDKYEELPTGEELSDQKDDKSCSICSSTGKLVRCNSCASSFREGCADIPVLHDPDDKERQWRCPECDIIDGSLVGSLNSGRKCSLDWFTLNDISCQLDPTLVGPDNKMMFDRIEFLVVHGFVFLRSLDSRKCIKLSSLLAGEALFDEEGNPPMPLTQFEIYQLLQRLGPDVCERWPFSQIPFDAQRIWPQYAGRCVSSKMIHNYASSRASAFNPFVYKNKYQGPPMNLVVSHMGKNNVNLLAANEGYINLVGFGIFGVNLEPLSRSTANDGVLASIAESNKCNVQMEHIRGTLNALAKSLFRSMLLHELWGVKNESNNKDWWHTGIERCESYNGLGILLVRLIDYVNPRAFRDEWYLPPGNSPEDFSMVDKENRVYSGLRVRYTPENEKRRRDWERCSSSDLLGMLAKESKAKPKKSCRKRSGKSTSISKLHNQKENEVVFDASEEIPRSNRRGRESLTRTVAKVNYEETVKNLDGQTVEAIKESMIFRLEGGLNEDFESEDHFTVAGRRIFEPAGSLPMPIVKWLGRNGGGKKAPGIFYTEKFEIGIPSGGALWRKKTLSCTTYAQLAYALQFVQSYFNKIVLASCEKLSARTGLKEHIQKYVACTRFDEEIGGWEHFVVHKSKWKGCWQSYNSVDASAFVVFRSIRIKAAQARLKERLAQMKPPPTASKKTTPKKALSKYSDEFDASDLSLVKGKTDIELMPIFLQYGKDIREVISKCLEQESDSVKGTVAFVRKERVEMIRRVYASYGNIGKLLFNKSDIMSRLVEIEEEARWRHQNEMKNSDVRPETHGVHSLCPPQQIQHAPLSAGRDHTLANNYHDQSSPSPSLSRINSHNVQHAHPTIMNDHYPSNMIGQSSVPALSTQKNSRHYDELATAQSYGTASFPDGGHSLDRRPEYSIPQSDNFGDVPGGNQYQGSQHMPQSNHQIAMPPSNLQMAMPPSNRQMAMPPSNRQMAMPQSSRQMAIPRGIMQNTVNRADNFHQYSQGPGPMHQYQNQNQSELPQQRRYSNNRGGPYHQMQQQPQMQSQQQAHYPYPEHRQHHQYSNNQTRYNYDQHQNHIQNRTQYQPPHSSSQPPYYPGPR